MRTVFVEQCATKVLEMAAQQEQEMAKHLDKAVEEYKGSTSFDMDATIVCRSSFMTIYNSIEADMQNFFPDFDLVRH